MAIAVAAVLAASLAQYWRQLLPLPRVQGG